MPGVAGVRGLNPQRPRPVAVEFAPGWQVTAVHDPDRLINSVRAEQRIHAGTLAGCQFGVEAMNQRLVCLASADEAGGLVVGPRPRWSVRRGGRERRPEFPARAPVELFKPWPVR